MWRELETELRQSPRATAPVPDPTTSVDSPGLLGCQNMVHGGAPDFRSASDPGLAGAATVQGPDLTAFPGRCTGPPQTFMVLPGMGQSGTDSFAQNLPLELIVPHLSRGFPMLTI